MTRVLPFLVAVVVAAGCAGQPPAAEAPAPVSGIDATAFDTTVRPQDDLFRYVNGGWLDKTDIPADKASYGTFDALFDKAQADLRTIVEEAAKSTDKAPDSDAQKIGDFYESFMDEARVEELGLAPLGPELDAIDRITTRDGVARYFARMFKLNLINPLVGFVDGDAGEPTRDILYIFQGGLGLPDRDYYLKDDAKLKEYREKYVAFQQDLLDKGGLPNAGAAARSNYEIELRLARAHWTNVENRDAVKTYNKVAVADLATEFPGFPWAVWIAELGIEDAPAVVVYQPSYVKTFAATFAELPVDRWKPYLKASLLNGFAPYLSKAVADTEFDFYSRTLNGVEAQQPRWKRGVNLLNANLGEMLGRLYVEKHFTPAAKARMGELIENLRAAFKDGIEGLEWMGPETKARAQEKLAKFTPKIGYPDKWRDYSQVRILKDDLVGNVTRAFLAESEYQLAKVGQPIDKTEWGMTPQTVNAYYNPVRNEIVFPAAILQPPFFDMAADDAMNYGAIGAVIGHEMGHGFDDQGRRYDGDGALRDWWTEQDAQEYEKRTKVLVEQFNAFEALPGLHVNGALTLGENIGDLTGITIAHRAYLKSLAGQAAPIIDGLTGDQRFYMGWAQGWRAKRRDDSLRNLVLTNPHAPEQFRAIGPVRNVPEFYAAFDVKDGDKMYLAPDQRVKIW
ncbi:MAG: M13 family metallopeptidase [Vicinamibacterales bacterium]